LKIGRRSLTELYCDHNIARQLVSLLRRADYDVLTADEIGLAAAKEDQQLLTAAQRERTLLTYDAEDFWLLHRAWLRWTAAWNVSLQNRQIVTRRKPWTTFLAASHSSPTNSTAGMPQAGRNYGRVCHVLCLQCRVHHDQR
jgi:predicted nuclease of predicted toxin-antitoxin system